MFNGRPIGGRPQVATQSKHYQYVTNSGSKQGETGMMYSQS